MFADVNLLVIESLVYGRGKLRVEGVGEGKGWKSTFAVSAAADDDVTDLADGKFSLRTRGSGMGMVEGRAWTEARRQSSARKRAVKDMLDGCDGLLNGV